jgi:hypothetical protein
MPEQGLNSGGVNHVLLVVDAVFMPFADQVKAGDSKN